MVAPLLLYMGHGMGNQRTIRRQVAVEGIGLHSGDPVKLTLSPAAADTGILFRAADGTLVPADIDHVVDGRGATTLGAFGVRVRTIEHLMAAAAALGIDNLVADMSAEEVPALDGSSKPFVDLLYSAGAVTLPVPADLLPSASRCASETTSAGSRSPHRTRSGSPTPWTIRTRWSGSRSPRSR